MIKKITSGICAGIMVSIGGAVFLSCENRYVGAILFAVALLAICYQGYSLFTGKVGYLPEKHDKEAFSILFLGLLGNAIGTVFCGYILRFAIPAMGTNAETICTAKLSQTFLQTLVRGMFCGILMYTAVVTFRDGKSPIGILFCIPVFILSGFEHSIADIFYFACSGIVSLKAFGFLWTVILGNSIGGMLLPVLAGRFKSTKADTK